MEKTDEFKIIDQKTEHNCTRQNDGPWVVYSTFRSTSGNVTGVFNLPEDWARTRVFQFIDDISKCV